MSLLDRGHSYEPCNVYVEVTRQDEDGNTITEASKTPIPAKGRFQIQGQSGTSSRRAEDNDEGYMTERVYTVQFPRKFNKTHGPLGAQSEIGWGLDSRGREQRWGIFGDVQRYNGSQRTAHFLYTIRKN